MSFYLVQSNVLPAYGEPRKITFPRGITCSSFPNYVFSTTTPLSRYTMWPNVFLPLGSSLNTSKYSTSFEGKENITFTKINSTHLKISRIREELVDNFRYIPIISEIRLILGLQLPRAEKLQCKINLPCILFVSQRFVDFLAQLRLTKPLFVMRV